VVSRANDGFPRTCSRCREWDGYWSRRIDREHRLVYKAIDGAIVIVQCRYHH
jgi:Txe/YoeB family toxin of toxin-antitoxin system